MKIEIVQYEPDHAYEILHRNVVEQNLWLSTAPDWAKWAKGWKDAGPAYTLFINDEIVGSAGIILQDWQRGEAWLLFNSLFYKYVKTTYKVIKQSLGQMIAEHDLRRVQALVDPNVQNGQTFMEHLGFEKEGLLKSFGPRGENLFIYARVR